MAHNLIKVFCHVNYRVAKRTCRGQNLRASSPGRQGGRSSGVSPPERSERHVTYTVQKKHAFATKLVQKARG